MPARLSAARRNRAAARRLDSARRGFERSLAALRRAAFDHIDSQHLTSLTLRLCLDRPQRCGAAERAAP